MRTVWKVSQPLRVAGMIASLGAWLHAPSPWMLQAPTTCDYCRGAEACINVLVTVYLSSPIVTTNLLVDRLMHNIQRALPGW